MARTDTLKPPVGRPGFALLVGIAFLLVLIVELALGFMRPGDAAFTAQVGRTSGLALIPYFLLQAAALGLGVLTALAAGAAMGKRGALARIAALLLFAGAALRLAWPAWMVAVRTFRESTTGPTSIDTIISFSLGQGSWIMQGAAAGLVLLGLLGLVSFGASTSKRLRRLEDAYDAAREEARTATRETDRLREERRRERTRQDEAELAAASGAASSGAAGTGVVREAEQDPREIDRDERTEAARQSIRDERGERSLHEQSHAYAEDRHDDADSGEEHDHAEPPQADDGEHADRR